MLRVDVKPELLCWARKRSHIDTRDLQKRFPLLADWERGEKRPTFRQLEDFAKATHTPFGYLFLPEPPEESMPIPDFRTVAGTAPDRPSPNLLDTIYAMQRRQFWLREERLESEAGPLDFVGNARIWDDPDAIGREMRRIVGIGEGWAALASTWQGAAGKLRQAIERLGVMAVLNGVVGNDPHRKLDVTEFRGFALCDDYAPLIFVNGADAKSAQMFTMAHELAHIWLGPEAEGVSGFEYITPGGTLVERFCDRAAAEFLLPGRELKAHWSNVKDEPAPFELLARLFKISPIVVGRRAMDLGLVEREAFFSFYRTYTAKERRPKTSSSGGDFYNNQNFRIGEMFAIRLIRAAKEGRVSFKEAYDLTGLRGGAFREYAHRLGIDLP